MVNKDYRFDLKNAYSLQFLGVAEGKIGHQVAAERSSWTVALSPRRSLFFATRI